MGGIATKRCESCRKLVMVSDRGDVETVGSARSINGQDDIDRAVCVCGSIVSWPRKIPEADHKVSILPMGALSAAHPKHVPTCVREGHDPLNGSPPPGGSGRLVTVQNICKRCGFVYATEALV